MMDNWPEKLAILAGLMWLLAFVANAEKRSDWGGAALWATFVFIPATTVVCVGMGVAWGFVWIISRAIA